MRKIGAKQDRAMRARRQFTDEGRAPVGRSVVAVDDSNSSAGRVCPRAAETSATLHPAPARACHPARRLAAVVRDLAVEPPLNVLAAAPPRPRYDLCRPPLRPPGAATEAAPNRPRPRARPPRGAGSRHA